MSISIPIIASISDNFSKLINKNVYEPLLCNLMNASKQVFPGQYRWNTEQSCGECDFVDKATGTKFDAKLPFCSNQGKLIGSRNHDFKKWIQTMMEEECEFGDDIVATRGRNIESLTLYKIMDQRMYDVATDEDAIFFFPYPIVLDAEALSIMHCTSDFLDMIYRRLVEKGKIGERKIYVIYPATDRSIVLRCLNNNKREYLHVHDFDEFLTYQSEF